MSGGLLAARGRRAPTPSRIPRPGGRSLPAGLRPKRKQRPPGSGDSPRHPCEPPAPGRDGRCGERLRTTGNPATEARVVPAPTTIAAPFSTASPWASIPVGRAADVPPSRRLGCRCGLGRCAALSRPATARTATTNRKLGRGTRVTVDRARRQAASGPGTGCGRLAPARRNRISAPRRARYGPALCGLRRSSAPHSDGPG
jgi:hypothetical protein